MERVRVGAVLVAAAVVLVVAILGAGPWTIDRFHPHDRIVTGARIWRCAEFGGSWPVEVGSVVQLAPGFAMDRFGTVAPGFGVDQSGSVRSSNTRHLVVARVQDASGHVVGMGTWNVGDGMGESHLGAVDDLARRVSGRHSDVSAAGHGAEIRAARECSARGLPK